MQTTIRSYKDLVSNRTIFPLFWEPSLPLIEILSIKFPLPPLLEIIIQQSFDNLSRKKSFRNDRWVHVPITITTARGLSNRAPRSSLFRRDPPRKILTTAATSYKRTNRFLSPIIEAILLDDDIPPHQRFSKLQIPLIFFQIIFPSSWFRFIARTRNFFR